MTTRFVTVGDDFKLPEVVSRQRRSPSVGTFTLRDDTEILRDADGSHTFDGAGYFSAVRANGPLGAWYGYITGHDSTAIWLVTADDVKGPWTWRQSVITGSHVPAPHVEIMDGTFYLYFHQMQSVTGGQVQPTYLATSADGVTFGTPTLIMPTPAADGDWSSYYAASTSYFHPLRWHGGWVGVFQANNYLGNEQVVWGTTTSVGLARSDDGVTWHIDPRPIMGNRPGERGLFAGSLFRIAGTWFYVARNGDVLEFHAADTLEPGAFSLIQEMPDDTGTGMDRGAPHVRWDGENLHLFYGGYFDPNLPSNMQVRHAYLEWSA